MQRLQESMLTQYKEQIDYPVNKLPNNLYKRICCTCFNIYSPVTTEVSGNVANL